MTRVPRLCFSVATAYVLLWGLTAWWGVPATIAAAEIPPGDTLTTRQASSPAPFVVRAELEYRFAPGSGHVALVTFLWFPGWSREVDSQVRSIFCGIDW